MTRSRFAEVECDFGPEPGPWECDETVIAPTIGAALEAAHLQGWQLGREKDYCPAHRTRPLPACACGGDLLGPMHESSLGHRAHLWRLAHPAQTAAAHEALADALEKAGR